ALRAAALARRRRHSHRRGHGRDPARRGLVFRVDDRTLDSDEIEVLSGKPPLGAVEQLLELAVASRNAGDGQSCALPELVVVDLGDRGAEAMLELRLRGLDVLALPLQRTGLREVQLDDQDPDVTRAHGSLL